MKQLLDFIPLFAFFATFKTLGIFPATGVLIASSILVYGGLWLKDKHLENGQKLTLVATILFGGITLLLHDDTYLKWKAPVINWIFALAFLASLYIGKEPLIQRMMGKAFEMPASIWRKLNWAWIFFFIVAGASNAYVAFYFEKYWVDFKVFGSLAMTFIFIVAQFIVLSRYVKTDDMVNK
ncbi:septation protein IspZ [Agitococcus lubricus]|uniref:Inner membrane-spanning protein YciB n=1 Tax=Agitococcus lubricus TaxID=1077255 RepID=A0A2T5IZT2_9GAMM|nr:septation protein IspZ [Agitococcus lubricus]PTQ89568.1 intracellular septation protein [Agitococcus lubricus]